VREDDIRLRQRLVWIGRAVEDFDDFESVCAKGLSHLNAPHLENWQWLLVLFVALNERGVLVQCRGRFYSKGL
jgi:hypothetical protein